MDAVEVNIPEDISSPLSPGARPTSFHWKFRKIVRWIFDNKESLYRKDGD